jgi:adenine-specific DNA-methyltransferase
MKLTDNVIEQVDEPRAEKNLNFQKTLFDIDYRGRQQKGWTNKLIWGDNKLILSSLKNGPMREEMEKQGGIKLIYIDPPFDVGADSFIAMIYERLSLMRDLLAEDGSIYVHCDWRVNGYLYSKSKNLFNQATREQDPEYEKKFDKTEPKTA